jgi:hypothetical protein
MKICAARPWANCRWRWNLLNLIGIAFDAIVVPGPPAAHEAEHAQAKSLDEKRSVFVDPHHSGRRKIVAYEDILLFLYSRRQIFNQSLARPQVLSDPAATPDWLGSSTCATRRGPLAPHTGWHGDDFALDGAEKTASRQSEIVAGCVVFSPGFATVRR